MLLVLVDLIQELQELFGLKNQSDYNDKITNLYAENGSEFVAGLGVMLGNVYSSFNWPWCDKCKQSSNR